MKILSFFLFFGVIFGPPGSGSSICMRIRIRIQQLKLMRIHANPDPDTDPDPKPCQTAWYSQCMKSKKYSRSKNDLSIDDD
jgi:hypothetical protein